MVFLKLLKNNDIVIKTFLSLFVFCTLFSLDVNAETLEISTLQDWNSGVTNGVKSVVSGFGVGKLLSILISVLAIAQGGQALDVTHIPFFLALGLMVVSVFVGIVTGWYPAERAKKISALNALRYE